MILPLPQSAKISVVEGGDFQYEEIRGEGEIEIEEEEEDGDIYSNINNDNE